MRRCSRVPAQAAPGPTKPFGVVTAKTGLSQRQYPSTDSSVRGYLHHRAQVGLVCKVRTQSVGGNTVWYLTRQERASWVSAKYVTNSGYVKYCKDVQRSRTSRTTRRSTPWADGARRRPGPVLRRCRTGLSCARRQGPRAQSGGG